MPPKTLFIVGAGASSEAGLPTGHDLKKEIIDRLNMEFKTFGEQMRGDRTILASLRLHTNQLGFPGEIDSYVKAGWHIRDAMPLAQSIDSFIDIHSGDKKIELCGKLAIVSSIFHLGNERAAKTPVC